MLRVLRHLQNPLAFRLLQQIYTIRLELKSFIFVTETPKITKRPQSSLTRNVSESIVLTCDASGCPKPEITWKRVGSNSVSHGRSSYHIPSISRSDDGSYVCFATTGGVTVNATTELKVQCKYSHAFGLFVLLLTQGRQYTLNNEKRTLPSPEGLCRSFNEGVLA